MSTPSITCPLKASQLEAMYQELLPYGIDPIECFQDYVRFLARLETDSSTANIDQKFATIVNKPDFDGDDRGRIFYTFHTSPFFTLVPIGLVDVFNLDGLTILMSKASRKRLPKWKNDFYDRAEKEKGLDILYVEDKTSLLRMYRILTRGGDVLMFGDAAIHTGHSIRTIEVGFLHSGAHVPTGAYDLANKSGAQIVPVIASNFNEKLGLIFADLPLNNDLESIYSFFSHAILANPSQWSQWGFMYDQSGGDTYLGFEGYHENHLLSFSNAHQSRLYFNLSEGYLYAH